MSLQSNALIVDSEVGLGGRGLNYGHPSTQRNPFTVCM